MKRIITLCAVLSVALAPAVFANCGSCSKKDAGCSTSGTNAGSGHCKKDGDKKEGKKEGDKKDDTKKE